MRLAAAAIALSALLFAPREARACTYAGAQLALIHSALPRRVPAGAIIADVVFESAGESALHGPGMRARVRRMIQGDFRGRTLILRVGVATSCDAPFDNGLAGLIVAVPGEMEGDALVVFPISVQRDEGFRLPDGFQLPARTGR